MLNIFSNCGNLQVKFDSKEVGIWFQGNKSIKEVIFGNNVESISQDAFINRSNLTSVIIEDGTNTIQFGTSQSHPFFGCKLENLYWGRNTVFTHIRHGRSGDIKINTSPFEETTLKTATIGDGMTTIDNYAFKNCKKLTSVTIPNSIEYIYIPMHFWNVKI